MEAAPFSSSLQFSSKYSAKYWQLRASLASNGSVGVLGTSMVSAPSSIPVTNLETSVWKEAKVTLAGGSEYTVIGGKDSLPQLNNAFKGIKQIAVIGLGSQVTAQAQKLRDSLAKAETNILVKIGVIKSSQLCAEAHAAGFTEENGTLGDIHETVAESDLVLLMLSRYEQAANYLNLLSNMKPNSILGLCKDILYDQRGLNFPKNISIISVCPKTMGPSVGEPFHQDTKINYARIYTIFGIHQDVDGRATDVAIGWSVALGSPFTFPARPRQQELMINFEELGFQNSEFGKIQAVESIFRKFIDDGMSEDVAYANTVRYITGDTAMTPSAQALLGEYNKLSPEDKESFEDVLLGSKSIVSIIGAPDKELDKHISHQEDGLPASLVGKISQIRVAAPPRSAAMGKISQTRVPARSADAAMGKISQTRVPAPPRSAAAAASKISQTRVPARSADAAMGKSQTRVPAPPRSAAAAASKISQTRVPARSADAAMGKISQTRVPAPPRSAAVAVGKISQTRFPAPPRSAAAAVGKISQTRVVGNVGEQVPSAAAAGEVIPLQLSADSLNANGVGSNIDTDSKDSNSGPTKGLGTDKNFLLLNGIKAEDLQKRPLHKMRPSVRVSLGGVLIKTATARGCNPSFDDPMVFELLGSVEEMQLLVDISSKGWHVGCATNHLKDIKSTIGIMTLPVIRPSGRTQGKLTIPYAFINAASAAAAIKETLMSGNSATCIETFHDCNDKFGSDSESETHGSDVVAEDGASCEKKTTRIGKISRTWKWKGELSSPRKCKDGKRIPTPPRSAAAVAPISQNPAANSSSFNASTDFGSGRSNVSELGRPAHNPSEITKWAKKALEITRDWGSLVITVIFQVVQPFSGCS